MIRRSVACVTVLTAALLTPSVPASAAATAGCDVSYVTNGDTWSFTGQITITNTGTAILYGWTLRFVLPAGQTLRSGWEATFTADGQSVTAKSLAYNSDVAPDKSVQVGFSAAGDVKGPRPPKFKVNDHVCTTTKP
ncbi:cellulose binding domain-containing protein [Actinoplanes couchii]|uniref:CBM2 domain-containing protein n=1 Tax=Actinoplanes couchii TaxID=403638 RepID=A0ABQ3X880_9ACTN|nr:cellulose binding domain-containing protein [Actinoplanes couchii]MDR6320372.1 cellulase/cellobiase CelA1 [Actinoplanes couchii]GID54615.1 hypothetical protein Aco03nite_030190 [Actinoplanes couchii]